MDSYSFFVLKLFSKNSFSFVLGTINCVACFFQKFVDENELYKIFLLKKRIFDRGGGMFKNVS